MKRIFAFLALCGLALAAPVITLSAQTPEEIIAKMDKEMERTDAEGLYMVMEMKIPILGNFPSKIWSLGKKARAEMEVKDKKSILWLDETTSWDYDVIKNEVTITNRDQSKSSDADNNKEMLTGITEGYKVTLQKETADAWYFRCNKSASNPKKDDPKRMDLIVSKANYMPISLSTKAGGLTITIRDAAIGVTEEEVTFDPSKYPGITVIDKR